MEEESRDRRGGLTDYVWEVCPRTYMLRTLFPSLRCWEVVLEPFLGTVRSGLLLVE